MKTSKGQRYASRIEAADKLCEELSKLAVAEYTKGHPAHKATHFKFVREHKTTHFHDSHPL